MAGQDRLNNYDKDYLQSFHQEEASGMLLCLGSSFSQPASLHSLAKGIYRQASKSRVCLSKDYGEVWPIAVD